MGAGQKNELITIEREVTGTAGAAAGGQTLSWVTLGRLWADVRYVRGGEAERNGALREINVYRFIVWSEAVRALTLTINDVVLWNGERYAIREVPRRLRTAPETEIIGEFGVAL